MENINTNILTNISTSINTNITTLTPQLRLPGSFWGGGSFFSMKDFSKRPFKKQSKGYTPSLTSSLFKIYGKRSKVGEFTGFGIRPIPLEFMPKKRKKKRK
jgi:hypothetical protein